MSSNNNNNKRNLLICPRCKTKMKRFLKSACLECPKCDEIYHIENLVYRDTATRENDRYFETEESAIIFLEMIINEDKLKQE